MVTERIFNKFLGLDSKNISLTVINLENNSLLKKEKNKKLIE